MGRGHALTLSERRANDLRELGIREGCTLYMTILAAFNVLLYRYTNQDDIVVATVSAGRRLPEIQRLMGVSSTHSPFVRI